MRTRRRAPWLAVMPALLLIASMSGIVSAKPLVSEPTTTTGWVDADGNGVADVCETAPATADDAAVLAANLAADLNGDGTISVSEAAQTDWIGGTNCNHGGYVSTVAKGSTESCDEADTPDESTDESDAGPDHAAIETSTGIAPLGTDTCTEDAPEADETEDAAPVVCEAAPVADGTTLDAVPLTHVQVAQSDAVGGKNCNHGGAVSESAKAAKAEREAARALKTHGNKHGKHEKHAKHGKHGGQ
jgi:hypothetical protein